MKTKSKTFEQHLYHDIEDEDKAEEYLEDLVPLIGQVVVDFNGLESSLNNFLCHMFTDRSDSTGLIVLHKMNYSSKVELFKRFSDEFSWGMGKDIEGYEELIKSLREAGRLRNLVIHADWENTDDDGYTYVALNQSRKGMTQEYVQFDVESMERVLDEILEAHKKLSAYYESREELLWGQ